MWNVLIFLLLSLLLGKNIEGLNHQHLVVVCHGLLGSRLDLEMIATSLVKKGYIVHRPLANELFETRRGIQTIVPQIAAEVMNLKQQYPDLRKISLVGNSLGGLFARYLAAHLFDDETNTIAGLEPEFLLTTASPHLGVLHYTIFDDYLFKHFSFPLRKLVASLFGQSGLDLALCDTIPVSYTAPCDDIPNALLYQMATNETFLAPLRAFKHRRLYANVWNDFLVPLGTSAMLDDDEIHAYHQLVASSNTSGILSHLPMNHSIEKHHYTFHPTLPQRYQHVSYVEKMMRAMNGVGWEKVLVYFPSLLPSAHNKIMALTKFYEPIDTWLGYKEGKWLVEHMVAWIDSLP